MRQIRKCTALPITYEKSFNDNCLADVLAYK